jgi:hypothetical protein
MHAYLSLNEVRHRLVARSLVLTSTSGLAEKAATRKENEDARASSAQSAALAN